tara:strand:+ start:206 stop:688 length:483 start_codon:yes stop_codon:yes gene_type:complete
MKDNITLRLNFHFIISVDYIMNCVYKLETPKGLYIGSTKNLKKRILQHKYTCRSKPEANRRLYIENDFTEFKFTVLEDKCENRRQREQYYMDELQPELNIHNAYGIRLPHKEYMKEYITRKYNCDCGATVLVQGRARHLRSEKHKDEIKKVEKIISAYSI